MLEMQSGLRLMFAVDLFGKRNALVVNLVILDCKLNDLTWNFISNWRNAGFDYNLRSKIN
ncbi:MAG: hypothetical protein ACTS4U_00805 [Candidatus Hodgkinia cicadicola]